MIVHLFIKNFFDSLGTAQHNPAIPANANLIHFPILLGPFAKSLGCLWRKTLTSTDRIFPFGPSILFSGLFLRSMIKILAASDRTQSYRVSTISSPIVFDSPLEGVGVRLNTLRLES